MMLRIPNVSKKFRGKKYKFMGIYDNDDNLVWDMKRVHKKHGYDIKIDQLEDNQVQIWKRRNRK